MPDYRTADSLILSKRGEIVRQQETIRVRPKTFELLLLLVEAGGALLDKDTILRTIWDDVSVDEQVVFQSIKELRKIFAGTDVIKTVPRKGYAWISDVEVILDAAPDASVGRRPVVKYGLAGMAAVILLLLILVPFGKKSAPDAGGAIIVLPVETSTTDLDHRWVRYGAMDMVIQQLAPGRRLGIYQTSDVLDVMKRADLLTRAPREQDIRRIFSITGASMVVQIRLAGFPGEYQLHYTLHQRSGPRKGVAMFDRIESGLAEVASIVRQGAGLEEQAVRKNYASEFANELLATALELMQVEDYGSAQKFLESAVLTEPENVAAKRLLVTTLIAQGEQDQALPLIAAAIHQAEAADNVAETIRLRFLEGISLFQAGQPKDSLLVFDRASELATRHDDWLYMGYISELRGHVNLTQTNYAAAQLHYSAAIDFHGRIQCPFGQANGYLNIARLGLREGNWEKARNYTARSAALITERELHSLERPLKDWQETLDQQ